ncbi:hypothetical protein PSACC_01392 [Paramicrosporidium saccamoebae]|uniref:Uncharacterized protein n=1 Tax=Paramicrosporidium saccamoebae TaxID=1246581 RepID=A0A2H9TM99_9FUNG|nr:hypothetical protein PSACC_01392 [Paramicrosporidium saccamoebae]
MESINQNDATTTFSDDDVTSQNGVTTTVSNDADEANRTISADDLPENPDNATDSNEEYENCEEHDQTQNEPYPTANQSA